MSESPRRPWPTRPLFLVLLGLALLVGGAVWAWEEGLKDRFVPRKLGVVVEDAVWRSGQIDKRLVEDVLRDLEIEVILDLAEQPESENEHAEIEAAERLGIDHRRYVLNGLGTGDIEQYAQALLALHEARQAGRRVLVHCAAGSERTGGIVAFYRVFFEGRAPREAVDEMVSYRDSDEPNLLLFAYMNLYAPFLAERLVELGALERVPDPLPLFLPPRR